MPQYYGNRERLAIEDPNCPSNDISGGTREIPLIFRAFSDAHKCLMIRLQGMAAFKPVGISILESIIAANYEVYKEQRSQLLRVFETSPQFAQHRKPPPPPPQAAPPSPPPPPPPA